MERALRAVLLMALLLVPPVFLQPGTDSAASTDLQVYADSLASGWADWSWSSTVDFGNTTPVHGGTRSVAVTFNAAWAGLYLHADPAIDTGGYESLSFWIYSAKTGNQSLRVVANGDTGNVFQVATQANRWTRVDVAMASLGGPATLSDLYWQDTTGSSQPVFYLDDITLVAATNPPPPPPPSPGPDLGIDVGAGRHAISEGIYGMNYADENLAAELRLPVRRWGGNSTSRYNWKANIHNTGMDWYFENIPDGDPGENGSASDLFVDQDRRTGTRTIMTVPLIGWTPRSDSPRDHPYACGFKVSKYGQQQSVDPWDTDCGNGVHADGSAITGNVASDTSTAIGADFVSGWISHLTGRYGKASAGGVAYYDLDNEPMLWNSTHRDVHPQPTTYDEMRDLTYRYAAAVKAADSSARTLGPVLWGWCAYFYSALDGCGAGSDYQSHGNTPFIPWYLRQMKEYEQNKGVRILDYLDLHYYPQANGVALSPAGSSSTQALRLRSTRSLWDPDYIDESWISDTVPAGVAVRLIPRMKEWVNANYPGTGLAITEYNWGALDSINGALAQADVLGIFGREGLDLATLWGTPSTGQPGAYAFRIFRNYDGSGGMFGDTGVQAASADQSRLSVYAAQRGSDNAVTIVAVNKTSTPLTSIVKLAGFNPPSTASVYTYSSANSGAIVHGDNQAVTSSGFSATFPANSITLFVMATGQSTDRTLTVKKEGAGDGTVMADRGTITWNGGTGTASYPDGISVTLTATPATGSSLAGWSGCDSVSANSCTLDMNADRSVTSSFNDVLPPAGSMTINSGDPFTKSASVTLNLSATDNSGFVASMQFSGDGASWSAWEKYAAAKSRTLPSGDGTKTLYARFRDASGNVSAAFPAHITLDTKRPVDGTLQLTPLSGNRVQADWSGFRDATSGIYGYRLMGGTAKPPASCTGTPIWQGTGMSFVHAGLTAGKEYYYRVCAVDNALNRSTGATASARAIPETAPPEGSILINGGAATTKKAAVVLTLAATDPSGVTAMCISNTSACRSWVRFSARKSWKLTSGKGTKTIYARFRDRYGNATQVPFTASILLAP